MNNKFYYKLAITLIVFIAIFSGLTAFQRDSFELGHNMTVASAVGDTDALETAQRDKDMANRALFIIFLFSGIGLTFLWKDEISYGFKRMGGMTLPTLLLVALSVSACGGSKSLITIDTNETAFVVPVQGDQAKQVSISNADAWQQLQVNTQEIVMDVWCWRAKETDMCEWRPVAKVIVVNGLAVTVDKDAAVPVVAADGSRSYPNAFCTQSIDATNVCVGGAVTASIEDPALYLASYGTMPQRDGGGRYPARPLASVLETEFVAFAQQHINREYSVLTITEQNEQIADIFNRVRDLAIEDFAKRGILIIDFGFRDGNQYPNPKIQEQLDSEAQRDNELEASYDLATKQAVDNERDESVAYSQATQTAIAVFSEVERLDKLAAVDQANQWGIVRDAINKWDGKFPLMIGGDSSSVFSLNQLLGMIGAGQQPAVVATPSQ